MESRWEGILASIFNRFWWILGGKMGLEKGAKTGQDRPRQDKTRQRQDKTLVEKVREGTFCAGEGVCQTIRGILQWILPPRAEVVVVV